MAQNFSTNLTNNVFPIFSANARAEIAGPSVVHLPPGNSFFSSIFT